MASADVPRFRNRGDSVSRLEGFSDTAFGFAITLLVVSLTVPTRFQELLQQLSGLPVFAVTFGLVATIWYAQYVFFRRYGLNDVVTVTLTLVLLFVVLFYVYPLKFLFGVVFQVGGVAFQERDAPALFLIYGLGFAGVNLVLALLYVHAYRKRDELGLTDWERLVTRLSIADNTATMMIGLLSAALAQVVPPPATGAVAGSIYFAVALPKFLAGWYAGSRARALARSPQQTPRAPEPGL
ncbi:MAG TPA: TMEM175 family protein [Candidatus Dormibacteraeota bacterium]|nr:TMEM175 family protein [Candidatus Dormibacteraeota bacterium]